MNWDVCYAFLGMPAVVLYRSTSLRTLARKVGCTFILGIS